MNELKFEELQEINGGLGGGPSYNHPKPIKNIKLTKKQEQCVLGTAGAAGLAALQYGPWGGLFGGMSGAAAACF